MIDVVIPTYNRALALKKVIDSYLVQDHLGHIIFVDDCSTDTTKDFVQELAQKNPGKILYHRMEQKSTLPFLRNVGMSLAMNEYVFMGEDDVLLPNDHFKVLLHHLKQYQADIISGRRINVFEEQTIEQACTLSDLDTGPVFLRVPFEAYFERHVDTASEVYTLHSNVLLKRSIFKKVQYDPQFGGNAFREETDFFLRAHAAGFHLWLIPNTLSFHLKRTSVNKTGGSRKNVLLYEWQVWKNTTRLFVKNRLFFHSEMGVKNIYVFLVRCLVARYTYALQRAIDHMNNHSQYEKK